MITILLVVMFPILTLLRLQVQVIQQLLQLTSLVDKAVKIAMTDNAHIDVLNVIDTRQFLGEMQDTLISGDTIYQMTQDSEKYLQSLKKWAHDNFEFDDLNYHIRYGFNLGWN